MGRYLVNNWFWKGNRDLAHLGKSGFFADYFWVHMLWNHLYIPIEQQSKQSQNEANPGQMKKSRRMEASAG